MNTADIARELDYDLRWIEFGILSPRELEAQFELFRRSEDKNTEHYRASAFRHYFQRTDAISDEQLERYLEIYTTSADDILKPNHLHELLRFPGLTDSQLQWLSRHVLFQDPGLTRIAQRARLLRDLEAPHLDPAIVESCLASADSVVQRALVEHANASFLALHAIARRGASKAVRNLARVKVDSQRSPRKVLRRYMRVISSLDGDVDCEYVSRVVDQMTEANPRVSSLVSPQNAPEGGFGLFLGYADADREFVRAYLQEHGLKEA